MEKITIFDELCDEFRITKPIRLIELFAGYGSQSMALKRIGAKFEHYRVVEFDKYAIKSYNAIHGTDFPAIDITTVHAADLGIVDTNDYCYMMTYSFPCTDLSVAGLQKGMKKGSGTRSGLLWEVERLLKEMNELPQILFMENVTQVHNKKNIEDFKSWLNFLESLGYSNYWKDLNAKDFGVPQNRERCFMISLLGNYVYHFPEPISGRRNKLKDLLDHNVDERFYLKSEKAEKLIKQLIVANIPSENENIETVLATKQGTVLERQTDLAATLCSRDYKGLRNRDNDNVVVEKMQKINVVGTMDNTLDHTFESANRVYSTEGIAPTLLTCAGGGTEVKVLTDTYSIRRLTPKEYGRLMGVSDEDINKMAAVNSNSQLYKQFGNSIVVDVMVAIFEKLNIEQEKEEND